MKDIILIYFFCQQGLETIKLEMEDVGEPLVDVNFGHGRYEHTNCIYENSFLHGTRYNHN